MEWTADFGILAGHRMLDVTDDGVFWGGVGRGQVVGGVDEAMRVGGDEERERESRNN